MKPKTKRLAGVTGAALALAAGVPVAAGAAPAPCRAVSHSTGSEVAIVLQGQYVDRAGGDVRLTCSLVQGGVRVASVTDPLTGPVAAAVSDERIGTDPWRVCYEVWIEPLNPWAPYEHYTDC